ncbi:unnamed protein product [Didymodactylos carnosus]|uniref:Uncharacterized protein n=1 Tax=Didymodactylos carnosus TaxID=1234261 RepID=A0A813ZUA3_9BILA|nr:unnamed protein product [Didymodactylos carnosus]CAF0904589.1 unnamed protein product [Didymodactylos carnosus]CAF3496954.1 unnamed protein product [Didymodactylos carnosus]CAF3686501.1 unnamed protein product [Didymodactylos carnosus]
MVDGSNSSIALDEPSKLKQFSWEEWDSQKVAVLFRLGPDGLHRIVVRRYIETVFALSDKWKQLSYYFGSIPRIKSYVITTNEVDLMNRICEWHLNEIYNVRFTLNTDQMIEWDDLMNFIQNAQNHFRTSGDFKNVRTRSKTVASIPIQLSQYVEHKKWIPPSPIAYEQQPVHHITNCSKISTPITQQSTVKLKTNTSSIDVTPNGKMPTINDTRQINEQTQKQNAIKYPQTNSIKSPANHDILIVHNNDRTVSSPISLPIVSSTSSNNDRHSNNEYRNIIPRPNINIRSTDSSNMLSQSSPPTLQLSAGLTNVPLRGSLHNAVSSVPSSSTDRNVNRNSLSKDQNATRITSTSPITSTTNNIRNNTKNNSSCLQNGCDKTSLGQKDNDDLWDELCPNALRHAKITGSGWVQINNVYVPYVTKNHQRLVPYQVLLSCKIVESDEYLLKQSLTTSTMDDARLMNKMIHEAKINNEEITDNSPLVNVYNVMVGTKNLIYVKLLPKDNPTSKINRQYKSVLSLRGGTVYIGHRTIPFVCAGNHNYVPFQDIIAIYPTLMSQLKPISRVPRMHELDYLNLVKLYYAENDLSSDTLLVDMTDLKQSQIIIPSRNMTLTEHHLREKQKLETELREKTLSSTGISQKRKADNELVNSQKHVKTNSSSKQQTSCRYQTSQPQPQQQQQPVQSTGKRYTTSVVAPNPRSYFTMQQPQPYYPSSTRTHY